jgi:molybdenum cofactor cytidylyltransferase
VRPKLSLPLGGRTVLEVVIATLQEAGVTQVLVVLGPHVPELIPLARSAGAEVLALPKETLDMRATVEHGLCWLEGHYQPASDDSWLLVPADHPILEAEVVRQLLHARRTNPHCSIVIPTFEGRRGHPALIDWKHVPGIRALPAGQGLNVYLRQQSQETLELPLDTPSILYDLDTPEDYAECLRMWSRS